MSVYRLPKFPEAGEVFLSFIIFANMISGLYGRLLACAAWITPVNYGLCKTPAIACQTPNPSLLTFLLHLPVTKAYVLYTQKSRRSKQAGELTRMVLLVY